MIVGGVASYGGVEPEVYLSAKFFVEGNGFNCYEDLDDNVRTEQMTTAKVCDIMSWQDQNISILNKEGFTVPLDMNENFLDECITQKDRDLDDAGQSGVTPIGGVFCSIERAALYLQHVDGFF